MRRADLHRPALGFASQISFFALVGPLRFTLTCQVNLSVIFNP